MKYEGKCPFCENLRRVKETEKYFAKKRPEQAKNYTTKYGAALISQDYHQGEPAGKCTSAMFNLNFCPECGRILNKDIVNEANADLANLLLLSEQAAAEEGFFNSHSSEPKAKFVANFLKTRGVALQRWIPAEEKTPEELPSDHEDWNKAARPSIDVLVKRQGLKQLYAAWYSYSEHCWLDVNSEYSFGDVTHWMYMPDAEGLE